MQNSDSLQPLQKFSLTFGDDLFSFDLIWNQLQWLTIITYCAKNWIYEEWQYYVSKCSPELLGLQAESRHTLVSLWWKALRASRVLSKSCLASVEESGTDTCQETSAGFLLESGWILRWVKWRLGGWTPLKGEINANSIFGGSLKSVCTWMSVTEPEMTPVERVP